jgi:hypothetical protein
MKVLKEITEWDSSDQLNHTYILNDKSRLIGYIPFSETKPSWFKQPMSFYKSRRQFVEQPQLVKELS